MMKFNLGIRQPNGRVKDVEVECKQFAAVGKGGKTFSSDETGTINTVYVYHDGISIGTK